MERKEIIILFGNIAETHGFNKAFGGWYKCNDSIFVVIELQKSKYSNCYFINIKIFIKGLFDRSYVVDKYMIKNPGGDFTRQISQTKALNLTIEMSINERQEDIENLFSNFIDPFVINSLSFDGIKSLIKNGELFLFPSVKKELGW